MPYKTISCSLCILMAASVSFPAATFAQEVRRTGVEAAGGAVCMMRQHRDVPQVRVELRGQQFRILTVERAVPALEAKGFTRIDCTVADMVQASKRNSWRDEICKLASTGNEAVQNQLERAFGERPAVLCAMAEAVAGQWQGPDRERSS